MNSKSAVVPTDMAVPLALIVNEFVTHRYQICRASMPASIRIGGQDELVLRVSDTGQGPSQGKAKSRLGLAASRCPDGST